MMIPDNFQQFLIVVLPVYILFSYIKHDDTGGGSLVKGDMMLY